jgi:thiamine-phosphate pyrophosphorylase
VICLVTDRRRLAEGSNASNRLVELVSAAASAGVDLIQVRERDLEAREQTDLVRRCVDAVRGTRSKVIVNDRVDVALAAGADGVHLRSDSIDASAARRILPTGAVVGRSAHSAEEAAEASRQGGLDYLILGTMFETRSKPSTHCLLTLEELSAASRLSSIPILAIGGITTDRARDIARSGAAGIAAIGMFIPQSDEVLRDHVEAVASAVRRAFDTCRAVS